jgi:hypothetical protein
VSLGVCVLTAHADRLPVDAAKGRSVPRLQFDRRVGDRQPRPAHLRSAGMDTLNRTDQIWDLRHGDADDNRTSPVARRWRNLAVTTLLDFN